MKEERFKKDIYRLLQNTIGRELVSDSEADRCLYSYDAASIRAMPDFVVYPESTKQVSDIMKIATRYKIAVTPRGAGTGTTGGAVPVRGGILMLMNRMNRVLWLDKANLTASVETGVVTGDFHKYVESRGLFYPPDPASSAFCTLGGNLAECAGGPRAVKYGVTRDYVLGLEAVLANGDIIKTGVQTVKGVVGYDLTRLIIGSEGTLAIITSMILRLLPLPASKRTLLALFDNMKLAASTVSRIIEEGFIPRSIEYMDEAAIRCAESNMSEKFSPDIKALLIIDVDGEPSETELAAKKISELSKKMGAKESRLAKDDREASLLWAARKALSPALFSYGPDKINEDIVVPRSKIPDVVEKIEELQKKTRLVMVSFGHAGDGNIHFNIMLDKKDKKALQRADWAVKELFSYVLSIGGTLSGEHGVGLTKQPYIDMEIGPSEKALMLSIKKAFDPEGILNPAKIF